MLVDAGQRAEGMAHLERAAQLAPSEPEAVYDIGTILLQDQNFPAAAARFEAALKITPGLGRGAQQPGHRAGLAGTHRRGAHPLRTRGRAEAVNADARANRDQARAAIRK